MIRRHKQDSIVELLDLFPAVGLIGPRQTGKTTLALEIAKNRPSIYLDLERKEDLARLSDLPAYLERHASELVILDEIQHVPDMFRELRGVIDQGIRRGNRVGRFLLLGSASIELLKQSSETLAGRIAFVELDPFDVLEISQIDRDDLWVKGGFPASLLAGEDQHSLLWRENFVRTYLERDIPNLGFRVPANTLRNFWTMLAHTQGQLLNAASLTRSLGDNKKAIDRYLDLMVDLLLVRTLHPYRTNTRKRLVKSPKIYLRDSGLLHALIGIPDYEALSGHPIIGASWEGFVIENILRQVPRQTLESFYRTQDGAEVDLFLELPQSQTWAIEIKRSSAPKLDRGLHHARDFLKPDRTFVVYSGQDRYPIGEGIEVVGLREICQELRSLA